MTPSASGNVLSPEPSALRPRPSWKYSEMAYSVPRKAIEASTMTPLPERNNRFRSSRRSTMGAGPQLDGHHGGQQHDPGGDRRQDLPVTPAQVGSFRDAVHQQPQAE